MIAKCNLMLIAKYQILFTSDNNKVCYLLMIATCTVLATPDGNKQCYLLLITACIVLSNTANSKMQYAIYWKQHAMCYLLLITARILLSTAYSRDGHQNLKLLLIDPNQMHLIGFVERTILVFKFHVSLQSCGL